MDKKGSSLASLSQNGGGLGAGCLETGETLLTVLYFPERTKYQSLDAGTRDTQLQVASPGLARTHPGAALTSLLWWP